MTWIKICGITHIDDALQAASLGVDAVGFVFAPSPRRVDPVTVRKIVGRLPSSILTVGVFVDEASSRVEEIAAECGLGALQFHGNESPEYCGRFSVQIIKAIRVKDMGSMDEMARYTHFSILLDAYKADKMGGTGDPFPWEIALKAREKGRFILAGGLNPENVGEAVRRISPWGVDVSSGVEAIPGKKDLQKMIDFVKEVRRVDELAR